jgi:hypothetical protein
MTANIGKIDKLLRVLVGSVMIILGAQFNSLMGVFGIIPIITSQRSFCPIYFLFGISTA